jgi:hypothetical protein
VDGKGDNVACIVVERGSGISVAYRVGEGREEENLGLAE